MAAYLPYVIGHNVFADTLTREAMQDAYALPPDIDETYITVFWLLRREPYEPASRLAPSCLADLCQNASDVTFACERCRYEMVGLGRRDCRLQCGREARLLAVALKKLGLSETRSTPPSPETRSNFRHRSSTRPSLPRWKQVIDASCCAIDDDVRLHHVYGKSYPTSFSPAAA